MPALIIAGRASPSPTVSTWAEAGAAVMGGVGSRTR